MKRLLGDLTAGVGAITVSQTGKFASSAALIWSIGIAAVQPRNWPRTVRAVWVRQVIASGVRALGITCFLAASLGVLLCVQFQLVLGQFNTSRVLPAVFVAAIVRELGPLLVNLILIARSGNAMATELALISVSGEGLVIEGLGINRFLYLVMPRVLALVFSSICLTILFVAASIGAVYLCGAWIGAKTGSVLDFASDVVLLLGWADVTNLALKCTIPPLVAGCICSLEGMEPGETLADVPTAGVRAVERSVVALFAISPVISIFTYLR